MVMSKRITAMSAPSLALLWLHMETVATGGIHRGSRNGTAAHAPRFSCGPAVVILNTYRRSTVLTAGHRGSAEARLIRVPCILINLHPDAAVANVASVPVGT